MRPNENVSTLLSNGLFLYTSGAIYKPEIRKIFSEKTVYVVQWFNGL